MAADAELELLQGTLDVLVLKTLSWGPRHGDAVARWIRETAVALPVRAPVEWSVAPVVGSLVASAWDDGADMPSSES